MLIGRDLSSLGPGQRPYVLVAATETQDARFVDTIPSGLHDRSVMVKRLVAGAVRRHAHLRTAQARQRLERLRTLRSVARSGGGRQEALRS